MTGRAAPSVHGSRTPVATQVFPQEYPPSRGGLGNWEMPFPSPFRRTTRCSPPCSKRPLRSQC